MAKPKSFQDIIKRRQNSEFVGRETQISFFRDNINLPVDDHRRRFIFNISGQGGVGKTSLLKYFINLAEDQKAYTTYVDEDLRDLPAMMAQMVKDLQQQRRSFGKFDNRYKVYQQKKSVIEAGSNAPESLGRLVERATAKVALKAAHNIPVAGAMTELIDEDNLADYMGNFTSYVVRQIGNKDEVKLVLHPEEVLTPLLLQGLKSIDSERLLCLCFDTYEKTNPYLDKWLRELLDGKYGDLPPNIAIVIAGRKELDKNNWSGYESLIGYLPLEPFTEQEARDYLTRKNVTNEQVITEILHFSGCLPLLVATLVSSNPDNFQDLGDASDTAVERFFKWIEDSQRKQLALDGALLRRLNQDVVAVLVGKEEAKKQFDWLKSMPFVQKRTDGWVYHNVVRDLMVRYKLQESKQSWQDLHKQLAYCYQQLRDDLGLDEKQQWNDETWRSYELEVIYHLLCSKPQKQLYNCINRVLHAKSKLSFVCLWSETVKKAGEETNAKELKIWGETLIDGIKAYDEENYETAIQSFTTLLQLRPNNQWLVGRRGATYRLMNYYEEALIDFNRAIELDPNYVWAIGLRGKTYQLMERYEEALIDFNRAIKIDPKYQWAIALRGYNYQLIQRDKEALIDFNRAIELDPEDNWAIALRGKSYQLMPCYKEALIDFNRAIELDPNYVWAIAQRGHTYYLRKNYKKALIDFNLAIKLDPEYIWAYEQRGIIYLLLKCYEEALIDFNAAIDLDPDTNCWHGRGLALDQLGRYSEAIESYQKGKENFKKYITLYNVAITKTIWQGIDNAQTELNAVTNALQSSLNTEFRGKVVYVLGGLEAVLGNHEKALEYLQQAITKEPQTLDWVRYDIAWRDLQSNPRFQSLINSTPTAN